MTAIFNQAEALHASSSILETLRTFLAGQEDLTFFQNTHDDRNPIIGLDLILEYAQKTMMEAKPEEQESTGYQELAVSFRQLHDTMLKLHIPSNLPWIEVMGDNMAPLFKPQDIVFYNPEKAGFGDNGLYVVQYGEMIKAARVSLGFSKDAPYRISHDNPLNGIEEIPRNTEGFKILGPVIGSMKRF